MLIGADLKERAQMSNPEAELFVQGLRSLMNDIGEARGWCFSRILQNDYNPAQKVMITLNSDSVALKR